MSFNINVTKHEDGSLSATLSGECPDSTYVIFGHADTQYESLGVTAGQRFTASATKYRDQPVTSETVGPTEDKAE